MATTAWTVKRIMGACVRLADVGLVDSAARNAAVSVAAHQERLVDEARTMRELLAVERRGAARTG